MFVAPNGKVFCAGASQATRYLDVSGAGSWDFVGNSIYGMRNWGSAVMYEEGRVLVMGGSPCDFYSNTCNTYPSATAETINLNSSTPAWQYTGSMTTGARKLHNATLLPDGKVLMTEGTRGTEGPNGRRTICVDLASFFVGQAESRTRLFGFTLWTPPRRSAFMQTRSRSKPHIFGIIADAVFD